MFNCRKTQIDTILKNELVLSLMPQGVEYTPARHPVHLSNKALYDWYVLAASNNYLSYGSTTGIKGQANRLITIVRFIVVELAGRGL